MTILKSPFDVRRANELKQMQFEVLTPKEADINGYLSLTTPYRQSNDQEMAWMKTVLRDMSGCNAILIDTGKGYEVARHRSELILTGKQ